MKKLITLFVVSSFVLTLCTSCTLVNPSAPSPSDTASGYQLKVVAEKGGTVPAGLNGRYPANTQIELTMTPNPGYKFYRWTVFDNGSKTPSYTRFSSQFLFTMPNFDVTLVASFGKASELFYLSFDHGLGGSYAAGMGNFYSGNYYVGDQPNTSFTMRVTPGYTFDKYVAYSNDGEVLWTSGGPRFTMPACDVTFMALFKEI